MSSATTGFTLPGMIDEPGCTAGSAISEIPVRGPEDRNWRSVLTFTSLAARFRRAAEYAANAWRSEVAAIRFGASTIFLKDRGLSPRGSLPGPGRASLEHLGKVEIEPLFEDTLLRALLRRGLAAAPSGNKSLPRPRMRRGRFPLQALQDPSLSSRNAPTEALCICLAVFSILLGYLEQHR